MSTSLTDLRQWKTHLRSVAKTLADEDRVLDAGKYFVQCQEWSLRRIDGIFCSDGGSCELMLNLMQNARNNRQAKQIEYLWDEFFPELPLSWHYLYRLLGNELMEMRIRCEKRT